MEGSGKTSDWWRKWVLGLWNSRYRKQKKSFLSLHPVSQLRSSYSGERPRSVDWCSVFNSGLLWWFLCDSCQTLHYTCVSQYHLRLTDKSPQSSHKDQLLPEPAKNGRSCKIEPKVGPFENQREKINWWKQRTELMIKEKRAGWRLKWRKVINKEKADKEERRAAMTRDETKKAGTELRRW